MNNVPVDVLDFVSFQAFQLSNAYALYTLSYHPECKEWQVPVLSVIFFLLFSGNTWTTLGVVRQKLRKDGLMHFRLQNKYNFNHAKTL
jgi:hypothetical protein